MSSAAAKLKHSLNFWDTNSENYKNTYDTWHLVPSKKPVIKLPEVRTNYVQVLGRSGDLDSTEVFGEGQIPYGMREDTIEFYIEKYDTTFEALKRDIANYLHGKKLFMSLDDDPDYYYIGRWYIDEARTDESWSAIVLKYTLEPYARGMSDASIITL